MANAHTLGVKLFDFLWEWTYDRQSNAHDAIANQLRIEGVPTCNDRCAGADPDRYTELSPWCVRIEASRRFRFWRAAYMLVWNLSIRLGLNA